MNTYKNSKDVGINTKKVLAMSGEGIERFLENKERRKLINPIFLTESGYVPIDEDTAIGIYYNYRLDKTQTKEIFLNLKTHKQKRINEIEKFLKWHNVSIDIETDSYDELLDFLRKNINFNEHREFEYLAPSGFWISVLIDISLLIGDHKIIKYPFLKWKYQDKQPGKQGFKSLSLYPIALNGKLTGYADFIDFILLVGRRLAEDPSAKFGVDIKYFTDLVNEAAEEAQTLLNNKP